MSKIDVRVGDTIELECPTLTSNLRSAPPVLTGEVIAVFDALFEDGTEGNLEIDIRTSSSGWIRYKPLKDGGTIRVISRGKNTGL